MAFNLSQKSLDKMNGVDERLQRVGNLCEEGHERSGYVVGRGPRPRTASIRRAGAL